MAGVSFNPALVTNAPGLFKVSSRGYVQGVALDDPSVRNWLVSGVVAPAASNPMWGGEAITESLVTPNVQANEIGSVLSLATAQANLTGFTVFNQSLAMIQSTQSPVPLAPQSGAINFYRLGSGARIAVKCSSAVAAALAGGVVNPALYWDYTNQMLLNAPGGTAINVKVVDVDTAGNSRTVVYNSGTGFATWNDTDFVAVIQI